MTPLNVDVTVVFVIDILILARASGTLHLASSAVPHFINVYAAIHNWQLDSLEAIPNFCGVFPQSSTDPDASLGHNEAGVRRGDPDTRFNWTCHTSIGASSWCLPGKPCNVSGPHEPLYIADLFVYVLKSRVVPPSQDMDIPTLQLPDDDDTTPEISIRRGAGAPIFSISDGAQCTHEGSMSDMSGQ